MSQVDREVLKSTVENDIKSTNMWRIYAHLQAGKYLKFVTTCTVVRTKSDGDVIFDNTLICTTQIV